MTRILNDPDPNSCIYLKFSRVVSLSISSLLKNRPTLCGSSINDEEEDKEEEEEEEEEVKKW